MTDEILPLDRYPQIVFESVTPAVVTLSGAAKSVTAATVTLSDRVRGIRRCVMCHEKLPIGARRHTKTCSANCRKAASRRNEAIRSEVQHIQDALKTLERYSDEWPDLHWDIMQAIGQAGIAASAVSRRVAVKNDHP
jgi:hypothetical protein